MDELIPSLVSTIDACVGEMSALNMCGNTFHGKLHLYTMTSNVRM